jgi:uncharacterized protein YkwD
LRKVLAVGGAAFFFGTFYVRLIARAGLAGRAVLGVVLGAVLVATATFASNATPRAAAELRPTLDIAAVQAQIAPIQTGWGIDQPVTIHFSAPMDRSSVEAALLISPRADVRLAWDALGSELQVQPVVGWTAGYTYSVSVGPGARSQAGAALTAVASAIVHVDGPASATLAPTKMVGKRLGLESGFLMTFSRPVDLASLQHALTISPAVDGTLALEGAPGDMPTVVWVPSAPFAPDTTYTVVVGPSAVDLAGGPLADPPSLTLRTVTRPDVVRFRPRDDSTAVPVTQTLSVRFSEAMDHASAQTAYHLYGVDAKGKRSEVDLSKAKVTWAEGDTVLVLDPATPLTAGTTYVAEVAASAQSAQGATVSDDADTVASATFSTVAPPASSSRGGSTTPPPPKSSGGGSSTAPWLDVEKYYLKLMNCVHTGGTLHSDGSCSGYGTNGNAALILDSKLSTCASRPWAKYLADTNQLYHGDVSGRFEACGYHVNWGENIGHNSYDPYAGAIHSMLYFQAEKSYNGGHYRDLVNPKFTHAGVGVWRENGTNWYVSDFWNAF